MWNLFYRRPRLLIVTIVLIVVWGLSAFNSLPRIEDPETAQRWGTITTQFPGANAYRVESLVTNKIEQQLSEIEEIETTYSRSLLNVSSISIKLKAGVEDVDEIWSQVRESLIDVAERLPEGVSAPKYDEELSKANTLIAAITWNLEASVNYSILSRMAEELKREFIDLSGTQRVQLTGKPIEEIAVEFDSTRLAELGLTPQDLAAQIQASDAKVSVGQLRSESNLPLETTDKLDSTARIGQISIQTSSDGQMALVSDVAQVTRGIKQPASELAIVNGKPAVVVAVSMESEQRIDRWSHSAHQVLKDFSRQLSPGLGLEVIFDQSIYVENRLNGLFTSLSIGAGCVVGTTLLMMGWRSGLIVGTALPLSVLMVFGCMQQLEVPLNQMSIIGLVIALGMLIDNAIVVVDEINISLARENSVKTAITKSLNYLAVPLLASTLTTVLTFLPIILLPGDTGEFVRGIGLSVIAALVSSLLVSLTIVPALAGRINWHRDRGRSWWRSGLSLPKLTRVYRRILDLVLAKPVTGIFLALIIPIMGFMMATTLELQMFSPVDRDRFYVEFELPPQTSIAQTETRVRQARKLILQTPEVLDVQLFLAKSPPEFYYNTDRWRSGQPHYAQAIVRLTSFKHSRRLIKSLQTELDRAFPDTRAIVRQLEQGDWFPAPIALRIMGTDLETLQQLGDRARSILERVPDITHTRSSLAETRPQLGLDIDEIKAKMVGLDRTAIARQLNAHLEGFTGGSILEEDEELPVRVRSADNNRSKFDNLTTIDLVAVNSDANITTIPLSSVAEIQLQPEIASITRYNGKRVNNIDGFITAGVLPSVVRNEFRDRLEASDFRLPPGYSMEWGGEFETLNDAIESLKSIVGVLVLTMTGVLVLSFSSFRLAGIVAVVGISSIGLGLASLWVFGYPLGFMSVLGIFGLIGVAINDSIVVLAALRSDPQAKQGDPPAVRQVVVRSTRHVLTTSITTVAGFVPLFLDGGEFWTPLAVSIAGGILGATLLALFFVPCTYLLLTRSAARPVIQTTSRSASNFKI